MQSEDFRLPGGPPFKLLMSRVLRSSVSLAISILAMCYMIVTPRHARVLIHAVRNAMGSTTLKLIFPTVRDENC